MQALSDKLLIMDRREWDSSGDTRLGYPVPKAKRTMNIAHHTVTIDNDATKNVWEWVDEEIKPHMEYLRTIRSRDLGSDVPYNWCAFLMPGGVLVVAEGRGSIRTGAHTKGHNTAGMALAFVGNFRDYPININPWLPAINRFWGWLKYDEGMGNLPDTILGHGLIPGQKPTACPGTSIIRKLGRMRPTKPEEEEDMASKLLIVSDKDKPNGAFYVTDWVWKRRLAGQEELNLLRYFGIKELPLDEAALDAITTTSA